MAMSQTHRDEAATTPTAHEVRDMVEREGTAPPAPTAVVVGAGGDPLIVGLPIFAIGSLALGMALIGVVDLTALGAIVPIILAGTGLYLLVVTVWAALLGQTMVAGITGTFSGFWLSLSILLLGLQHNWYGITLLQVISVQKLFFIAWAALFFFLLIPCLMLPIVYPAVVGLVVVALCLAASSFFAADTNLLKAAGYVALVFSLLGFYAFLNVAFTAMNSKEKIRPPLGKAIIS
jgi:succinate-acetate transporter protein